MAEPMRQVLLPFAALPTTDCVMGAVANVIRDIEREHDLTDHQFAERIGVHVNTIARARNKQTKLDLATMARIGAVFGEQAVRPLTSLWSGEREDNPEPVQPLALAVAAISAARGPKGEFDALPAAKIAADALASWIASVEQKRLRVVA